MERKHRLRGVRNLLAAALLLALLWWIDGCPLPTREMEFHRYERQSMIGESAIVFTCESEGERMIPGRDPVMLVGVSKRTVQTSSRTHKLNIWPKNPAGATLVVLPSELEYEPVLVAGLVAVEPPAEAETARLAVSLSGGVETVNGEKSGEVFLFRLKETGDQPLDCLFHTTDLPPYTLEFFDAGGMLLETVTNP